MGCPPYTHVRCAATRTCCAQAPHATHRCTTHVRVRSLCCAVRRGMPGYARHTSRTAVHGCTRGMSGRSRHISLTNSTASSLSCRGIPRILDGMSCRVVLPVQDLLPHTTAARRPWPSQGLRRALLPCTGRGTASSPLHRQPLQYTTVQRKALGAAGPPDAFATLSCWMAGRELRHRRVKASNDQHHVRTPYAHVQCQA